MSHLKTAIITAFVIFILLFGYSQYRLDQYNAMQIAQLQAKVYNLETTQTAMLTVMTASEQNQLVESHRERNLEKIVKSVIGILMLESQPQHYQHQDFQVKM